MTAGVSYSGSALTRPNPWSVEMPWAEVWWPSIRWRRPESCLRGAVLSALGDDAHVDYHSHQPDGSNRQEPPSVCYRITAEGCPLVYLTGPRAMDHVAELARLRYLETRETGAPAIRSGSTVVQVTPKRWMRYELVTPYRPSGVVHQRRPRQDGPERRAWAGQALTSSLLLVLEQWGIDVDAGNHRPTVHVEQLRNERTGFRGEYRWGFRARFVANVALPPGVGVGSHRAFGFGEVREWA